MAFSDEVDEITRDVRRFTATQLRAKFPYMKTPAFQKVLNDVAAHLRVGLVQQKPSMIATQATTSFMDLPPELRNTIYEMALCRRDGESLDLRRIFSETGGRAALSRVNRVIHQESSSILYGANTFEIKIDIMTVPPHSQMPNLLHTLQSQLSYAIQWLKSIGANSATVKCMVVGLRTDAPPLRLLRNLLNAARGFGNAVWTAHRVVLQVLGLLGLGMADEAFKIRVASVNSRHSQAAKDLYEAAGISGNELYSVPLLRRLAMS